MELLSMFAQPDFWIIFGFGVIGNFLHFAKKKFKKETVSSFKDYISAHQMSTITAFLATFLSVVAYYQGFSTGATADLFVAASIGFNSDSIFNKMQTTEVPPKQ